MGQRENSDSTHWHNIQGEFVITGWEIPPNYRLRVDWTSINQTLDDNNLWTVPYWDADGTLTLGLDAQHPTSMRLPILTSNMTKVPPKQSSTQTIEFKIHQNYSNPLNPKTTIHYQLDINGKVTLKIYNTFGQEIRTLVNENQLTGCHSVVWDGKDHSGNPVSSGLYFYTLKLDDRFDQTKKMAVIK